MPELLNHRHCKNCDRATPYDEDYCSDKCRDEWTAFQKKRKNTARLYLIAAFVTVGLLILQVTGKI